MTAYIPGSPSLTQTLRGHPHPFSTPSPFRHRSLQTTLVYCFPYVVHVLSIPTPTTSFSIIRPLLFILVCFRSTSLLLTRPPFLSCQCPLLSGHSRRYPFISFSLSVISPSNSYCRTIFSNSVSIHIIPLLPSIFTFQATHPHPQTCHSHPISFHLASSSLSSLLTFNPFAIPSPPLTFLSRPSSFYPRLFTSILALHSTIPLPFHPRRLPSHPRPTSSHPLRHRSLPAPQPHIIALHLQSAPITHPSPCLTLLSPPLTLPPSFHALISPPSFPLSSPRPPSVPAAIPEFAARDDLQSPTERRAAL